MKKFYFLGLAYFSIFALPILLSIFLVNFLNTKSIQDSIQDSLDRPIQLIGLTLIVGLFFYSSYKLFRLRVGYSTQLLRFLPIIFGVPFFICSLLFFTVYSNSDNLIFVILLFAIPLTLIAPIIGSTAFALFSERKYFLFFFLRCRSYAYHYSAFLYYQCRCLS